MKWLEITKYCGNSLTKPSVVKGALSTLDASERELIFKGPLLVCLLLAGADGEIDNREIRKAIEMARDQHWVKSSLHGFFQEVATDFEDKLKVLMQAYPSSTDKRNEVISAELSGLNELWSKLGKEFSEAYYEMLRYLAERIASSSGGFWGKITTEEAKLLDLPMLKNPSKK